MTFNYPNFIPSPGNLTYQIQIDYLTSKIRDKSLPIDSLDNKKITSLIASNNPSDPIFFWQLYSILGESPIHTLISIFYENVFNDNDKWFSEEFIELGSLEYHIKGQKRFWLDIMGGGKHYVNGMNRLNLRHSLVDNIMTVEGSNKWLENMNKAPIPFLTIFLNDFLEQPVFLANSLLTFNFLIPYIFLTFAK